MEEKDENVVEETTQQETTSKEEPKVDDTVEKIKVKKKPTMKKLSQDDEPIKVDMSKPPKNFESAGNDILGGGFDLGSFDPT